MCSGRGWLEWVNEWQSGRRYGQSHVQVCDDLVEEEIRAREMAAIAGHLPALWMHSPLQG